MSNVISIYVKRQRGEPYIRDPFPQKDLGPLGMEFNTFMETRFPLAASTYSCNIENHDKDWVEVWIQPILYGKLFEKKGYKYDELWMAMVEFIFSHWSHIESIEMRTSWSG